MMVEAPNVISEGEAGLLLLQSSFKCKGCGECCRTQSPIVLSKYDIMRMSESLDKKPEIIIRRHLKQIGPERWAIRKTGPCKFLRPDNRCKIYSFRPTVCRQFPYMTQVNIVRINRGEGLHLGVENCAAREHLKKAHEMMKVYLENPELQEYVKELLAARRVDYDKDETSSALHEAARRVFDLDKKIRLKPVLVTKSTEIPTILEPRLIE